MKRALFVLWVLVVWQIAAWSFAPVKGPPQPTGDVSTMEADDQPNIYGRERQRDTALRALDGPWSGWCTEDGRKAFIESLDYYYQQRQNQMERYPEIYGKAGADFIARQWQTPDDARIDRLTREAYVNGYLTPADFVAHAGKDSQAAKLMSAITKDERVSGRGCGPRAR